MTVPACGRQQVGLAITGATLPSAEVTRPTAPGPERLETFLREQAALGGSDARLEELYRARRYAPAFFDGWQPRSVLSASLEVLRRADRHGLDGLGERVTAIERQLELVIGGNPPPARALLEVEVGLSAALLSYAEQQLRGRAAPEQVEVAWHLSPREGEPTEVLERLLETSDPSVLDDLAPSHSGYEALLEGLARYRELAERGGWEELPPGETLRPGDQVSPERLEALARRLAAEGHRAGTLGGEGEVATYGSALEQAVRAFQERHGIAVDGAVGPATLRELNTSAEARVEQIRLNLDRWRWLPAELGERRAIVNVPAFDLRVLEGDRSVLEMRVVVGREGWGTPFFSESLEVVVLNPYWNVPDSIARAEIIPQLRQDPGYAERNRYTVLTGWSRDAAEVDPNGVDWASEGSSYRFRRAPGPSNPLGRMKFLFPDAQFSIYLHDTPAGHVFERAERAASHGCVRVERPYELAEYVLAGWDRSRIEQTVASGRNVHLRVDDPLAVHLVYFTAEMRDGEVYFYPDVYAVDAAQARALQR